MAVTEAADPSRGGTIEERIMHRFIFTCKLALAVAALVSIWGCDQTSSVPAPTSTPSSGSAPPPPPPPPPDSGSVENFSFAPSSPPAPPTPEADTVPARPTASIVNVEVPSEPNTHGGPDSSQEQVVADVGVGKKGRGYGGGMISEPAKQYFSIRERVVFQIQIPQAMKHFKAIDPDGNGPVSHKDFMEKIVNEANVELPELPRGEEYWYDAETEELMVLRPKP